VQVPPGNWSLQPEAVGAAVEVTKLSKPSMTKGRLGDLASKQAVTRVNAEQASKILTREPTQLSYGEGRRWRAQVSRPRRGKREATRLSRPAGVVAMACLQGNQRKHGKPQRWRRVTVNETPARDRLGRMG
jgi:hypothetical protein